MTTYTAIADTDIDVGSPITTGLMTKLRDNPIAITEGSSGAPNIQTAAIANSAVTTAKIADANVTEAKLAVALQTSISNGAAKAWVRGDNANGTTTIRDSFNVTSLTDHGAGDKTINFTTSFANTNYTGVTGSYNLAADMHFSSMATGSARIVTAGGGSGNDFMATFFGDQ